MVRLVGLYNVWFGSWLRSTTTTNVPLDEKKQAFRTLGGKTKINKKRSTTKFVLAHRICQRGAGPILTLTTFPVKIPCSNCFATSFPTSFLVPNSLFVPVSLLPLATFAFLNGLTLDFPDDARLLGVFALATLATLVGLVVAEALAPALAPAAAFEVDALVGVDALAAPGLDGEAAAFAAWSFFVPAFPRVSSES